MIWRPLLLALLVFAASPLSAQHGQPYAGRAGHDLKALSPDEIEQYLAGAGLGFAKAAELNHYPGPKHVLELAQELQLTGAQREATALLMRTHQAEARELGRRVVAAERRLDALFKSGTAVETDVAGSVREAAVAAGDYRLSHLETHRKMRSLLTEEQIARYD